jgi:hypothetical protein
VTETDCFRIQKFDSNGGYLAQWGSTGIGNGQFNFPQGVARDGQGNCYGAFLSLKTKHIYAIIIMDLFNRELGENRNGYSTKK